MIERFSAMSFGQSRRARPTSIPCPRGAADDVERLGGGDENLLWDASSEGAGAADVARLDEDHRAAGVAKLGGRGLAGVAGTENERVDVGRHGAERTAVTTASTSGVAIGSVGSR